MIIRIDNLIKRYQDNVAIDHLSLDIEEGEIFGLLGPNGAGKTTLINSILGLTKTDEGTIKIFGRDFKGDEKEIKKQLGVVPQDLAIYEDLTAYENVALFASLYGLRGKERQEKVKEALDFVGLLDRKDQYPKKFSGGMKRRLNIAIAIVHQPKLIIMDEPTVGIDPQSRNQILESVKILKERGATIIYTSHYMEEVEAISTNIAIMDKGRVIAKGTKEDLKGLIDFQEKASFNIENLEEDLIREMKEIKGITSLSYDGSMVEATWNKNQSKISEIVKLIVSNGYDLKGLKLEEPNLERVFLTLTGKKLRD